MLLTVHCHLLTNDHMAVGSTCAIFFFASTICVSPELSDPSDVSGAGGPGDRLWPGQRGGGAAS